MDLVTKGKCGLEECDKRPLEAAKTEITAENEEQQRVFNPPTSSQSDDQSQ